MIGLNGLNVNVYQQLSYPDIVKRIISYYIFTYV
jgi:hypothetical protein